MKKQLGIATAAMVAIAMLSGCSSMRGDRDSGATGSTSSSDTSSGTSRRAEAGSSSQAPDSNQSSTIDCTENTGQPRDPRCPPQSDTGAGGNTGTTPPDQDQPK